MASGVLPSARALYLCDYHVGYETGKVDLYGLFNTLSPTHYPWAQSKFCVFAQLTGGLGQVPFFVDVRHADDELVYTTATNVLSFPDRTTLVQLALSIKGCSFPRPGVYLVELFCDNTWVCDTTLLLRDLPSEDRL